MLDGKKLFVFLPARNVERTLEKTYADLPRAIIDEMILIDNNSKDRTVEIARRLGMNVIRHEKDLGYGRSQKEFFQEALKRGADVMVMIHPDYQYPPKLTQALASMVTSGMFDLALGSRMLNGGAMRRGMPLYKYVANRVLTVVENGLTGLSLSEYHSGFRAFSRDLLLGIPFLNDADDFCIDNQIIVQAHYSGFRIGELCAPTHYTHESTSVPFLGSVVYGLEVLKTGMQYRLQRWGLGHFSFFANPVQK